jgi:anti-sigma factor RsiW
MRPRQQQHLAGCLACQAEAAKYRSLYRSLQGLRRVEFVAPPGLVASVLAATRESVVTPIRRHRAAVAALATGAAAIVAGGVALILHRQRRVVA